MSEQQPLTWDEVAAELERIRDLALGSHEAAADSLMHGMGRREALSEVSRGLLAAAGDLEVLHNRVAASAPPETPTRPLEAVLADIHAEGHEIVQVASYPESARCESKRDYSDLPAARDSDAWTAWRVRVEDGHASGPDAVTAAEARLAQVRALHAEKLAKAGLSADLPAQIIERAMAELGAGREPYPGYYEAKERLDAESIRPADEVAALDEATLAAEGKRHLAEASETADGEEG